MMNKRLLEIYYLTGIGDSQTIEICNWLSSTFTDMLIEKQGEDILSYSKNGMKIFIKKKNTICFNYSQLWSIFSVKYNIDYRQTESILTYAMLKYFKMSNYKLINGIPTSYM